MQARRCRWAAFRAWAWRLRWNVAAGAVFLAVVGLGAATLGDYGLSWDEPLRFRGGDAKLAYYQALLSGESASPSELKGESYPGLFDLPLAAAHAALPGWGTRSRKGHVWSFCFGLLGLLAAWRLTARLGGARAGFWALLLLATLPRYYGHMFFNPKDIPFAATYLLGVWALVALFQQVPRPAFVSFIGVGLAAGLAASARLAGVLILCYLALFALLHLRGALASGLRPGPNGRRGEGRGDGGRWGVRLLITASVALLLLLLFWPMGHRNPFTQLAGALRAVQHYDWPGAVLMNGRFFQADSLPIYYIPYWLWRTTPEVVIFVVGLACVAGSVRLHHWVTSRRLPADAQLFPPLLLLFAGLFPLLYLTLSRPVLYDGIRHFLFAIPPLVCVGALGLDWLLRRIEQSGRRLLVPLFQAGVAMAVGVSVAEMVSLHPYEYIYFNQLSGGLPGAQGHDETDYWGLAHREAAEFLNRLADHLDPSGTRTFKVHQRYTTWLLEEFLDARFEVSRGAPEGADFAVAMTRCLFYRHYPDAKVVHLVHRQGVPLCYVFALPRPEASAREVVADGAPALP